jgi:hypothetical protein
MESLKNSKHDPNLNTKTLSQYFCFCLNDFEKFKSSKGEEKNKELN